MDVEIACVDLDERIELLPDGEIVIRGHNLFSGYLGRSEETTAALTDGNRVEVSGKGIRHCLYLDMAGACLPHVITFARMSRREHYTPAFNATTTD
ncbi:hypothetical protein [Streptomyces sp. NPDC047009]|uniref:hypothetical protein n=1 Tax=Streptomyces sp. NPDC047009 TaxID=3154496 RepID=UPI0033DD348B